MLRHFRALHETAQPQNNPTSTQTSRKQMVDEALVNMVIKDSQPFSVVEDEGFRGLIHALDPSYIIPNRQALKKMVALKYEEAKRKAKAEMEKATAVSLTSDMWTSINTDAYLAITCHYIDDSDKMNTVLLDVEKFPDRHTAENMALVKKNVMMEWAIKDKVKCLVTDAAANMIACAKILQVRHSVCIAHALNTMVKKSFDQVPALCDIRNKAKKVVTYFRSSTSAKEMLTQVQKEMNSNLVNDVETRWNSTLHMLQRLHEERQTVEASLASLKTDIAPLHAQDYEAIQQILCVLAPFHLATVELSEEKRVSGSKVIPLLKMIHYSLLVNHCIFHKLTLAIAKELTDNLIRRLREHIWNMESLSIMTMATLLDPRFKTLGFLNHTKMTEAVKRLKAECANVIRAEDERPSTSSSTQSTEAPSSTQQPTPSSIPPETRAAWPVCQPPSSSTYPPVNCSLCPAGPTYLRWVQRAEEEEEEEEAGLSRTRSSPRRARFSSLRRARFSSLRRAHFNTSGASYCV
ncbi:zinc finger BED domain-containing protein 4-like [Megalobrama amblycephala]|uniref:zinc finger BED domain-containing protein 4-like n=1 Tax=Megalobrama amblycephala TaxID=75352 RepID=UPI002013FF98|nr:zinc finger BED domain-containing protein 4-like [Megalobrama amblycephala]